MTVAQIVLAATADAVLVGEVEARVAQNGEFSLAVEQDLPAAIARLEQAPDVDIALVDGAAVRLDQSVWRALRAAAQRRPVLVIAGGREQSNELLRFDHPPAAADIFTRPISFKLLLERLRAHAARRRAGGASAFPIGPYHFTPDVRELRRDGAPAIALTAKECAILLRLFIAGGEAVERGLLLRQIWGYSEAVTTHTLETHVYRLRRKIEQTPHAARILLTVDGGYRLAAT